jgi:hypothetical protein
MPVAAGGLTMRPPSFERHRSAQGWTERQARRRDLAPLRPGNLIPWRMVSVLPLRQATSRSSESFRIGPPAEARTEVAAHTTPDRDVSTRAMSAQARTAIASGAST